MDVIEWPLRGSVYHWCDWQVTIENLRRTLQNYIYSVIIFVATLCLDIPQS